MKRIDDKIKEIEKKDKRNRWVYYIIVALLAGFLYFASTTREVIKEKDGQIAQQLEQIKKQLETEQSLTKQLDDSINELNRSLKPDEYWNHIVSEKSVESYIAFLTNDWGIDKTAYITPAIKKLKTNEPKGFEGWLWVGSKNNQGTYTSKDIVEIIYRQNYPGESATLKDLQPEIGDVVKLKAVSNRNTYKNNDITGVNQLGWRNKTKAFVSDVYKDPGSINFNIKIKYY